MRREKNTRKRSRNEVGCKKTPAIKKRCHLVDKCILVKNQTSSRGQTALMLRGPAAAQTPDIWYNNQRSAGNQILGVFHFSSVRNFHSATCVDCEGPRGKVEICDTKTALSKKKKKKKEKRRLGTPAAVDKRSHHSHSPF